MEKKVILIIKEGALCRKGRKGRCNAREEKPGAKKEEEDFLKGKTLQRNVNEEGRKKI